MKKILGFLLLLCLVARGDELHKNASLTGTTNLTDTINLFGSTTVGDTGSALSRIKFGLATLVAGTVTVSDSGITSNSRIWLTAQSLGTVSVAKALAVTARVVSTSFTITSADATDTSTIAYLLIEP